MARLLAIGDIHGCSRALDALLLAVELQSDDRLVTLGDYVDRGPDTRGVLDRMIALHATGRLVALRGNHELIMLHARTVADALNFWRAIGGRETLHSYAATGQAGQLADVPDPHWRFMNEICRDWYETDRHFFVHAGVEPTRPLDQQPSSMLHWEYCGRYTPPHSSGKIMVCGHSEQHTGWPLVLGHAICLDTWAYGGGWLTCLDVLSGKVWQANQRGHVRDGWINEPV